MNALLEIVSQPWAWYVAGPMIALVMFTLFYLGRTFGVSSTMRTACSLAGGGRCNAFFDLDLREHRWNLVFILGAVVGGLLASTFLGNPEPLALAVETQRDLAALGVIGADETLGLMPASLFSWDALFSLPGLLAMVVGGFLVGFGARYAGGCTSGHGITGLSTLQWPSLLAVSGFFVGGLLTTHFVLPLIF